MFRNRRPIFLTPLTSNKNRTVNRTLYNEILIWLPLLMAGLTFFNGCSGDPPVKKSQKDTGNVFEELLKAESNETETVVFDPGFRFQQIADSGIDFVHHSGNSEVRPFPAANGSGVGVLDFDLDGFADVHFGNGTEFPVDLDNHEYTDRLYRNVGGFRFQDVSALSGVAWNGYTAGVAVGDFDSDGFPDIYLNCYGQNRLFQNLGDGTFRDVTGQAAADDSRWGSSAVFCDYNMDGLLDLYVGNYAIWDLESNEPCFTGSKQEDRIFCSPMSVEGAPDKLLENQGDGTFRDVSEESGILQRVARTQGVMVGDFDRQGGTDFYLGNDMHPNSLFMNDGEGKLLDQTDQSGMGYDHTGKSQAGMGLAAADVDQNGSLEVFVTNYANEHNSFYQLVRKNGYSEASSARGLSSDSIQWVGWGTVFLDVDMDQWPDLLVTNGHTDHNKPNEPYEQPCLIWKNQDGRFKLASSVTGDYFQQRHVGRGLAIADFDNDGDWDLVFAQLNQPAAILRNDTPIKMSVLALELEGRAANRDAVSAKVYVTQAGKTLIYDRLGGGSYLSTHQGRMLLPIEAESSAEVTIEWPVGEATTLSFSKEQLSGTALHFVRQ